LILTPAQLKAHNSKLTTVQRELKGVNAEPSPLEMFF
jgi:hypothetical protein